MRALRDQFAEAGNRLVCPGAQRLQVFDDFERMLTNGVAVRGVRRYETHQLREALQKAIQEPELLEAAEGMGDATALVQYSKE